MDQRRIGQISEEIWNVFCLRNIDFGADLSRYLAALRDRSLLRANSKHNMKLKTSTSVFGDWRISTYNDPTSTHRANLIGTSWSHQQEHSSSFTRAGRFVGFRTSGGAKFPKMGDSLPRTPMNRPAKFDAASFILGGEIRNRTNKQNYKQ